MEKIQSIQFDGPEDFYRFQLSPSDSPRLSRAAFIDRYKNGERSAFGLINDTLSRFQHKVDSILRDVYSTEDIHVRLLYKDNGNTTTDSIKYSKFRPQSLSFSEVGYEKLKFFAIITDGFEITWERRPYPNTKFSDCNERTLLLKDIDSLPPDITISDILYYILHANRVFDISLFLAESDQLDSISSADGISSLEELLYARFGKDLDTPWFSVPERVSQEVKNTFETVSESGTVVQKPINAIEAIESGEAELVYVRKKSKRGDYIGQISLQQDIPYFGFDTLEREFGDVGAITDAKGFMSRVSELQSTYQDLTGEGNSETHVRI
ncbi:hypothetical protein RBH20_09165 [Haloarcula sp. H-GB4]|uniref:hypothetical protein n=1 Tax=Haloarcula sp. H-GB4 TaxID=3069755 RepID=UPI0027B80561|nr:hypothetical protein [Haloarcula sp. H-GB4]MDQ2072703.1 hypothetical protein [Haloarcula sp. H-GB4]